MQRQPLDSRYQSYLRDESRLTGEAEEIAFPRTAEDIAGLFAQAAEEGTPVTIQGSRTGIAGGAVPHGGMVVSTQQMNRLLGLRPLPEGGFALRLQAGCTLEQVEAFLTKPVAQENWSDDSWEATQALLAAGRHRFLPNPTEATASVGGLLATNAKGSNALRYGSVGSHCVGLDWVTPRGDVWQLRRGEYRFEEQGCPLPDGRFLTCPTHLASGGAELLCPQVGMDLIDFLAGSEGMVGCAAQMELSLVPEPSQVWSIVFFFQEDGEAHRFVEELRTWHAAQEDSPLSAGEYYDAAVLALVNQGRTRLASLKGLSEIPASARAAVHLLLEGDDPEAMELALGEQLELFESCGGREDANWAAMGSAETAPLLALRHSIPELLNTLLDERRTICPTHYKTATDFQGPTEQSADYCAMYHQGIAQAGVEGYVFGHILDNRLHTNLLAENEEQLQAAHSLIEGWADRVAQDGGVIAGENGIGRLRHDRVFSRLSPQRREQIAGIVEQLTLK